MRREEEIQKEINKAQANHHMDSKLRGLLIRSLQKELKASNESGKHDVLSHNGNNKINGRDAWNVEDIIFRISEAENPRILDILIREAQKQVSKKVIKIAADERRKSFNKTIKKAKEASSLLDKAIIKAYQKLDIISFEEIDSLHKTVHKYMEDGYIQKYREKDVQEIKKGICTNILWTFTTKNLSDNYQEDQMVILSRFYSAYPYLTGLLSHDSAISVIQRGSEAFFKVANARYNELVREYENAKRHYANDKVEYKFNLLQRSAMDLLALQKQYPFLPKHIVSFQPKEDSKSNPSSANASSNEIPVKWSKVTFRDKYLIIGKYGQFVCEDSRQSLNALTTKIDSLNLPPIIIKTVNSHIEVSNLAVLKSIVLVLSVKDDMPIAG